MKDHISRILVPLDPSIYSQAATRTACQIAKKHGAGVAGIAVLASPEIRSSLIPAIGPYYPGMIDAVQTKINHAKDVLEDCLALFATECANAGVEHLENSYEGIPAEMLLRTSMFHDLLVMGLETSFHFETRGGRGDTLDKLLQETATPILSVPAEGMLNPKKVIIAFDGSNAAAQALHDFALFASPYDFEISIVVAEKKEREGNFLAEAVADYLRAHGLKHGDLLVRACPVEDVITSDLLEATDLVVAGIHSKRPIKDRFVGGFTKKLIHSCDTALFLSH